MSSHKKVASSGTLRSHMAPGNNLISKSQGGVPISHYSKGGENGIAPINLAHF